MLATIFAAAESTHLVVTIKTDILSRYLEDYSLLLSTGTNLRFPGFMVEF